MPASPKPPGSPSALSPGHRRPLQLICLLLLGGLHLIAANGIEAADRWSQERHLLRSQRMELRNQAAADVARRAGEAAQAIGELVTFAEGTRVKGQDAVLNTMLKALERMDPQQAAPLRARLQALASEPEEPNGRDLRTWQRALDRAKRQALTRTGDLLNRAIQMGIHDLAHGFLHEILAFDPDNAGIRRGLDQVKVEGRWLNPYEQQMARQGLWWDETLGWIVARDAARYQAGDYFDLQFKRWTTMAEANQRRAQLGQEWVITTRNIRLHSTLDLADAVAMVNKLEQFYASIFAAYAGFFATSASDYKLVMGLADHPPLVVWVYRNQEQFTQHALTQATLPDWAGGFWSPRLNASFFYAQSGGSLRTMYHEFTHQTFHIFAGGNRADSWLTESIAVYNESPLFADGDLILGDYKSATRIRRHRRNARSNEHRSLTDLVRLDHTSWSAAVGEEVSKNYEAAGALAWFCMEIDDRKYRADFVDFLRDSYRGATGNRQLWDYLGLSSQEFSERYQSWERAQ